MLIESYSFGRMVVSGEEYHDDLMIYGTEVNSGWVREEGHKLYPKDLSWVMGKDPDILVVGTGSSGRLTVTEDTKSYLRENGIDLWMGRTDEAADYFNVRLEGEDEEKVSGAFHLTC